MLRAPILVPLGKATESPAVFAGRMGTLHAALMEERLQAVVLVGGEGTRLRPLTYGTPKPMVPIFGVPFLERTLSRLKHAGIDEAILAAGYLPQAIRDHFGDGSRLGMRLTYVVESEPLGTAGALKNVEEHITGPFFVLNGDVLTSLDLRTMMDFHQRTGGAGALHSIRVDDPSAFGCIVHDDQRPHHVVRREAAARDGADQRDQRRHLPAVARGAGRDSRGA